MSTLIGFLPFIAFAVLAGNGLMLIGLICGLVLAVGAMLRSRSAKLLEAGSAVLFGLLALYAAFAPAPPSLFAVRLAVDAGLAAIVLVSLVIGRPFTLQYAREQVPPAMWDNPVFLATNRRISAVWAAAFVVLVAGDLALLTVPGLPRMILMAAEGAALAAAIWFTGWYPRQVRRRFASAAGTGVL